ncbi:MAG: Na+/H+ antiporter [Deltaproteobacteria bacterium]|nr:Na+/H+ antiporter [Deltaproteobacteria bacterium]
MNDVELILVLLGTCVVLAVAAERIRLPYPIVLVLGGIALAFTPVPRFEIRPDIVLVIFLPPLLFSAAWLMSWREFRANLRAIGLLAIGLVVATTLGVALVAHALVPGLPWSVAFVIGAIVSPPDAVAATSVLQRMHVPARLNVILEGESLVNDATGLVAYQIALASAAGATFSLSGAAVQFGKVGVGGVAFGVAVGWVVARAHRRLDDSTIETAISLLTPYIAYIPAEHLGVSGVLAAVTAGGYLGWRSPRLFSPTTRLRSRSVWEAVLFVLNGLVFVLMGLELAGTHKLFTSLGVAGLAWWCAAIAGATIVIRLLWVPLALRRLVSSKERVVIAWTAMRGIVSLALALALPDDLPYRDLVVLVVFVVIAVTLVGQGLTLPLVVRAAKLGTDDSEQRQERDALLQASEAAIARLDAVAANLGSPPRTVGVLRTIYTRRAEGLRAGDADEAPSHEGRDAFRALRAQLIEIERETIIQLRDRGEISEETLQRLQRDLDLELMQPAR